MSDAEGSIIKETTFYPFGEPRHEYRGPAADGTLISPYLFGQKERDEETNLHYFESRYLAAALGRFNRVDPVVEDVPTTTLADPQLLNPYSFSRNSPVVYKDPDGRLPESWMRFYEERKLLAKKRRQKRQRRTRLTAIERRAVIARRMSVSQAKQASARWKTVQASTNWAVLRKKLVAEKGKLPRDTEAAAKEMVANVLKQAEGLKDRVQGTVDVEPFIKAITEHRESIERQVKVLLDTMKMIDIEAKFEEFKQKAGITGDFKEYAEKFQKEHEESIKKFKEKFMEEEKKSEDEEEKDKKEEEE